MARLLQAGRLVAPVCLALTGCLPAIPTGAGSDTGSLFDVGLADLGVDFDTGGTVTPPDGSDDTNAGSGSAPNATGSGAPWGGRVAVPTAVGGGPCEKPMRRWQVM